MSVPEYFLSGFPMGESLEASVGAGNRAAGRNATFRGASALNHHLRGALLTL